MSSSLTRHRGLQIEPVGEVTVARLAGPDLLDEVRISALGQQLNGLVASVRPPRLLLNFAEVERFSSAVVGLVVALHKRAAAAGGRLALCGLRPSLHEALAITRLDRILNLYPDEATALLSFS